jgi:phosphopantothenoylcysteine decarboxylase / phosphopantothenate---cysteine ligase
MNIVLGVCGSIASYRAADLARDLMRAGHTVRVCLTDAAQQFVTPILFETLTGQPCLVDVFEEPVQGRMAHIDWARSADLLLIAPATANTISRIASGIGEDMLTTIALAYTGPVVFAPAMNPAMYLNEATAWSIKTLAERGALFIEPTEGDVACGEHGQGKLAANSKILEEVLAIGTRSRILEGKHLLITSGPTQEPIDDVRYLTNRSSGRMGAALARAALLMGAKVTVVTGPVHIPLPLTAEVIRVHTALEMLEACRSVGGQVDIIIGAAAVADFRPASKFDGKIRRQDSATHIDLIENPDVLGTLASEAKPGTVVVGFAAEPTSETEPAREKIKRKGLYAIAMNDISRQDIGFESSENELTLITADGNELHSGKQTKLSCAFWLLEAIAK